MASSDGIFTLNIPDDESFKTPAEAATYRRADWEAERKELLQSLDSALSAGFAGLRQDMDEQTRVLARVVEEMALIRERMTALEAPAGRSEPAGLEEQRGKSHLDKIRNKEAREFWEEVFGDQEEVKWALFEVCLAQKYKWLKEVSAASGMWAIQEALDLESKGIVTVTAYAALTNMLGLRQALAELLPRAVSKQEGFTCLMHASNHGKSLELVEELCELGGRDLIFARTKDGSTCLFCAAWSGHVDIARYLCKAGGKALFNAMQQDHWTPLAIARQRGNTAMEKALEEEERAWS
uniref:Adaptor protein Cbl EF hand-like domain-containing protein n=1 Tax=Hemiselmis andersenii TaxID=464988 RepID=A0A6U2A5C4_HEMAN|mmetsp:Transcript_10500/g.24673  ORF Transcript_10500/g.24673 Transcript_10500/m.24673 type:complete len:295 (+) Transcript_10500:107-991(+)